MRGFISIFIAMCLLAVTSAAAAQICVCKQHEKPSCHKEMTKQEKQEKKDCCCDKAINCKTSLSMHGATGSAALIDNASVQYAWRQEAMHSRILTPALQPPQA